jgi:GTP pyrophosphokinase
LPGDEIFGIVKNGTGISVHKSDCKNLINVQKSAPERVMHLNWKKDVTQKKFLAKLKIGMEDKPGNLAAIVNIFASKNINVSSIKTAEKNGNYSYINFEIEVNDLEYLKEIKDVLKTSKNIASVERI